MNLRLLPLTIALLSTVACGEVAPLEIQHSHVFQKDGEMDAAEIPASSVLAGNPRARVKLLAQASDQEVHAALWDCTAGKFKWHFRSDELVHILEGDVTVTSEGSTRHLKLGDVAYFSAGTDSVWDVQNYVKKLAVLRSNRESMVRRAQRKLNRLFAAL